MICLFQKDMKGMGDYYGESEKIKKNEADV
jgi:hypothetical protein